MTFEANVVIIGAGIIGLSVAAAVAGKGREVYIIEKNETFGQEISSRNSEVIHAGIYYPEGSLKAKTCVEGNALIYELCRERGIGCRNTGKLVVAVNDKEIEQLEGLLEQGKRNGARDLAMLSKREISELEPNIKAVAAVFSPYSGTVDSYALMRCFLTLAKEKGVQIAYKSKVTAIEKLSGGYDVTLEDSSGTSTFRTEVLINCAGLYSDQVAELAGIDIDAAGYRLKYCKGEYFSVGNGKNKLVDRQIYPVPEHNVVGLGTHVTLDLEGRMKLGPNVRYVDEIDYKVDESGREAFYRSAKTFLPFIEIEDLEPEMAGIRPKLQGPGEDFRDFVIQHEEDKGLPGFINLIGIESPGMTSSPAIAKYVEKMLSGIL